jgi:hypothetical protein
VQVDPGKLAQAEHLVSEIRQQLNVAEHVLAREAKFTMPVPVDSIDPQDLVARVERHFGVGGTAAEARSGSPANATTPSNDGDGSPVVAGAPATAPGSDAR